MKIIFPYYIIDTMIPAGIVETLPPIDGKYMNKYLSYPLLILIYSFHHNSRLQSGYLTNMKWDMLKILNTYLNNSLLLHFITKLKLDRIVSVLN